MVLVNVYMLHMCDTVFLCNNDFYNIWETVNQMDMPDDKNCDLRLHNNICIHALKNGQPISSYNGSVPSMSTPLFL